MKKNFFCKLPFIHTASSPAGKNLVCCEGNGDGSKLNDGVGPYDFLNSKFMNEIRNGFLSENPLENKTIQNACENCIVSERKFGDSKRLRDMSWKMHQDPDDDLLKKNIARQKKGMPIETISNIHLQGFGNHCNLSCVMCSAKYSDKWGKWLSDTNNTAPLLLTNFLEKNKEAIQTSYRYEFAPIKFSSENMKIITEQYKKLASKVFFVDISGGEPLLQNDVINFIEELKKENISLTLSITTNGTVPVKVVKKVFDKIDTGNITISLDSIGKRGEYIRAGTEWERYEENVFDYNIYAKQHGNLSVNHFTTIQALNIGYIDEILDWIRNYHTLIDDTFRYHFLVKPDQLRTDILPKKIKNIYLENTSLKGLTYVENALKSKSEYSNYFNKLIRYLDLTDIKNGTNWKELWPEFEEYINETE